MTALRVFPSEFGYAPAREARLASERAFERAVVASCSLVAALFALAFLLRGLQPGTAPLADRGRGPVDIGGYVLETWPARNAPSAPFAPSGPGVPVPVPEPAAVVGPDPEPAFSGTGGAAEQGYSGGLQEGGAEPGPAERAMPEPGEWVPVQQLPDEVFRVAPVYPDLAREAQVEGTVQLWALVDLDGSVREVRVRKSVPLLDQAAVDAVARWRFTPALDNGRPVRVWVAIPVRFTLH